MKISNEYKITIARNIDQVDKLRDSWEKMQWHPNADIDFYSTLVRARCSINSPHVMLLSHNGLAKTMFVGRIEDTYLDCKFGYKTIFRPKVKALLISYGGILGDASTESGTILISEITKLLSQGEADMVYFSNLNMDSKLYSVATRMPNILCRDPLTNANLHWGISVPANMEEYFNTIDYKFRKNLRRAQRNIIKSYPGKIEVRHFREVNDVNTFMHDAELIASKSYQRRMNVGFKNDDQTMQLAMLAAQLGWFRGYILYIDDRPVSFERTTQYGKTLFCENAAYDPAYKNAEPGTNLFLKILEYVCSEKKVDYIDFGFGDAFYKKNFCNRVLQEQSVYIFAPTIKGVSINLIRIAINSFSHFAEKFADRLKITQKIKTYWRNRLNK